jgi:TP901-1 family phage major tail protein
MSKVKGVSIIVEVDMDQLQPIPSGTPDWEVIGGQQNATLSEEVEAIDTTTKDSDENGYDYEPGKYSWSVSADGLYVKNDLAYGALKSAMRTGQKVKLRIMEEGQPMEEGFAICTSRELEAGYEEMATYSLEFQGIGIPS